MHDVKMEEHVLMYRVKRITMLWARLNKISESPAVLNLGTSVEHEEADRVNCLSCAVGYCTCSGTVTRRGRDDMIEAGILVTRVV